MHDTADRIARLKFALQTKPETATGYIPVTVYEEIGVLAAIIDAINQEIGQRLAIGLQPPSPTARQRAEAYSRVLDPLGEAVTELGRLQTELIGRIHQAAPSGAPEDRLSDDVIAGCLEAAIEALDYAATHLRETAIQLAPPASPRASASRPRTTATPTPPNHPATAAPRATPGR